MKKFSDVVNDRGFLTEKAKKMFGELLLPNVDLVLSVAKTETEIRVLSSILKNMIASRAFEKIQDTEALKEALEKYKDVK